MDIRAVALLVLVALGACGHKGTPANAQGIRDSLTMQHPELDTAFMSIFGSYADKKITADSAARLFLDYVKAHQTTSVNVQMDAPLREAIVREQQRREKR